jgi:hypothetical protein
VEVHGVVVRIASCSSLDIITWSEENSDETKKRLAGLRLAVKCIVDEAGNRVPEESRDAMVAALASKDAKDNGTLVRECLKLNGLDAAARAAMGKSSPEVQSAASPSGSPGTSGG